MTLGPAWNGYHPVDAEAERALKDWALGPRWPSPLPASVPNGRHCGCSLQSAEFKCPCSRELVR